LSSGAWLVTVELYNSTYEEAISAVRTDIHFTYEQMQILPLF